MELKEWMKTWKMRESNIEGEENFFLNLGMNEQQEHELTELVRSVDAETDGWTDLIRMVLGAGCSPDLNLMIMHKIGCCMMRQSMDHL